jgi:hypothetical protein
MNYAKVSFCILRYMREMEKMIITATRPAGRIAVSGIPYTDTVPGVRKDKQAARKIVIIVL